MVIKTCNKPKCKKFFTSAKNIQNLKDNIIFRIPLKIINLIFNLVKYFLTTIENLIDILKDKIAYDKVIINFFLTFIIPILVLNMPISGNMNEFTSSWHNRIAGQLQQGLLFSTTMSIAATYISTYISRVNELADKVKDIDESDQHDSNTGTETRKNFIFISNYSNTLFWALSILLLSAILLGVSRTSNSSLNIIFVLLQAVLYFGILITYGYSEKINRERGEITSEQIIAKTQVDQQLAEEEGNRMNLPTSFLDHYREQE